MRRLCTLGLVGATVVACVLLLELTPLPHVPVVTEKLDRWRAVHSDMNVLFVGSSRVYRHLSPEVFDRSMRRLGHRVESFNLGIPAVKTPEMLRILRQALAEPTPDLRWVVIELDGLESTLMRANTHTWRAVWWHHPAETRLAIAAARQHAPRRAVEQTRNHLTAAIYRFLQIGRLRRLADERLRSRDRPEQPPETILGRGGRGFVPVDPDEGTQVPERRAAFRRGREAWRVLVASYPDGFSSTCKPSDLKPSSVAMIRLLVSAVRDAGAEPVFVTSPAMLNRCEEIEAWRQGLFTRLLRFDRPRLDADLFLVENRYDHEHLNAGGARVFSERVAARLAESIANPSRPR